MAAAVLDQAREQGDGLLEACAATHIAWFCFQTGDIETGLRHAMAARRLFQTLGSKDGEAAAGAMAAWLLLEVGLSEEAAQEAVKAIAHLDGTSDPAVLAFATNVLGCVFWSCRQIEQALPLCLKAVSLAERTGDPVTTAWWRVNLAGVHAALGTQALGQGRAADAAADFAAAMTINQQALDGARRSGDLWCQRLVLCNAAEYLCAAGRVEEAAAHLVLFDALPSADNRRSRTQYLFTKTGVLLQAGRAAEALPLCREALRLAVASGDIEAKTQSFRHMSAIHEHLGAYKEALDCFKQFFAANQMLAADNTQRLARIASVHYDTHSLRQQAEAAEAQVASLVQTVQSDPLTGLPNRRAFDRMLAGLADLDRPYAIAIVDLDHFKRINDSFSHMVGDEVLKQVGAVLVACVRPGDLAARLGGEEFALVLDGIEATAADRLCEAVRRTLAELDWKRHHAELEVTASIGVAHGSEADTPAAVLALADRRLYQAKTRGRNRVVTGTRLQDDAPQRRAVSC